ncbi:unnamed protein product, partial [Ectocarpus fasciculatus]
MMVSLKRVSDVLNFGVLPLIVASSERGRLMLFAVCKCRLILTCKVVFCVAALKQKRRRGISTCCQRFLYHPLSEDCHRNIALDIGTWDKQLTQKAVTAIFPRWKRLQVPPRVIISPSAVCVPRQPCFADRECERRYLRRRCYCTLFPVPRCVRCSDGLVSSSEQASQLVFCSSVFKETLR